MRQIYDFEHRAPPSLSESGLRKELERRKLRRQLAVLASASVLILALLALIGVIIIVDHPWLGVLCLGYVWLAVAGSAVLSVVAAGKGGAQIWLWHE